MTENDFLTISYLQSGSSLQQKAYHTLSTSPLFTILKDFNPVLTGTMPLDLFVDGSDLDICCEVYDQKEFKNILDLHFGEYPKYRLRHKFLNGIESIICSFTLNDFVVEIVGQPKKVTSQIAFRHMIAENHILRDRDFSFKKEVLRLKKEGLKTEPAFAQLLGLKGDPYTALLTFTL